MSLFIILSNSFVVSTLHMIYLKLHFACVAFHGLHHMPLTFFILSLGLFTQAVQIQLKFIICNGKKR